MGGLDRERQLALLADTHWDLLVIGGGISGAGVLREAARRPAGHPSWCMAACGI
jgi:hypothetical protein